MHRSELSIHDILKPAFINSQVLVKANKLFLLILKMTDKVSTSLSLLRRLPPNKIEKNVSGLISLLPAETDELLQRVDQPLQIETDPNTVSFTIIALFYLVFSWYYFNSNSSKLFRAENSCFATIIEMAIAIDRHGLTSISQILMMAFCRVVV